MKRNVSIEEISDGRLYGSNDMVKAGCGGCRGCSQCCHGMGESVILDPLDACRLAEGLGRPFGELLNDKLELHVVDGIILPNLRMEGEAETCGFLNGEGRCSIHPYRPGVCRLFPLGRYYLDATETAAGSEASRQSGAFRYFLQVHECPMPNKTKVKVSKWVDTPELSRYEAYISSWHSFLEEVRRLLPAMEEAQVKNANLYLLKLFFLKPYDPFASFYPQFEERLSQAEEVFFS